MQPSSPIHEAFGPVRARSNSLGRRHSLPSALPSTRPSVVLISQNGIVVDGSVIRFGRSSDALSHLAKAKCVCDVIVLDADQPHRDSLRMLSFLKRDPLFKRIPVIVASHSFRPGDIFKYAQEGADEIIDLSCSRITELVLWMVAWRCSSKRPQSRQNFQHRRNSIAEVSNYNPRKRVLDFCDEEIDQIGHQFNQTYGTSQPRTQTGPSAFGDAHVFRQPESKRCHSVNRKISPRDCEALQRAVDNLSFNAFEFNDAELIKMTQIMFEKSGLVQKFQIPTQKLRCFISSARAYYKDNHYHNFRHAVDVTQMVYWTIQHADKATVLNDNDKLILIISAICHDLLHPGFNNSFFVKTRHELAIKYNDTSVLENLHANTSIQMLLEESTNILSNLDEEDALRVKQGVVQCIMSTDMANHQTLLQSYQEIVSIPYVMKEEHKPRIRSMILKFSDISNPARKFEISKLWSDAIMEENFIQGDIERSLGFEIAPFIDRRCKDQPKTAIGFSQHVVFPLLQTLCVVFPGLSPVCGDLDENIQRWKTFSS